MAEIHQRRWRTATKWLDTALENQIARRSIIGRKLAVRRAARGRWNWGGRICGSRAGGGLCTASARSRIRLGCGGYRYPVGARYAWHAGYWTRPPYAHAYWVGPRYFGHRYYRGYWRR